MDKKGCKVLWVSLLTTLIQFQARDLSFSMLMTKVAAKSKHEHASEECDVQASRKSGTDNFSSALQACSILYKTRLPLLVVYNKVDVARHEFAVEWMKDYEAFQAALEDDPMYASQLSRSLSLVNPSADICNNSDSFWSLVASDR